MKIMEIENNEATVSPFRCIIITHEATTSTDRYELVKKTRFPRACSMLLTKGTRWFDAFMILTPNLLSQMVLLFPSMVAYLGWRMILITVFWGILSCWNANLVQFFYFQYYRSAHMYKQHDRNMIIQLDKLLSNIFRNHGQLKILGMLGMGFNFLCLFTRPIIQFSYAVSIAYFVNDTIDKSVWTIILACGCIPYAIVPTLRNNRGICILSFAIATVATLTNGIAYLLHEPVQGVEHSVPSSSIQSWALVGSTIVYAFGDSAASVTKSYCVIGIQSWALVGSTIVYAFGDSATSVETLVVIKEWDNQNQFKYAFWGSTAYSIVLSMFPALSSYWRFGNQLSKISLASQPCALALLPPSPLRDIASILLLIHQVVAIGYSLYPVFIYIKRVINMLPCTNDSWDNFLHGLASVLVVGLVSFVAYAIPFSGSMEITSLVGCLIVCPAIFIITSVACMLYFGYSQHREDAGLSCFWLTTSYLPNIIASLGVSIIAAYAGYSSINYGFLSHHFHRSDFWNR